MKLPTFSLNIFKKPTKKKRIVTTFGKRGSTASSSTRKSRRASSSQKPRKRSITYYAPSKSKFYPIEHFPTLQRAVRRASLLAAATPLASRSYQTEERHAASTDVESKLNTYPSASGTLRSYAAKQTYLCDNEYGDIILHQPPAWYMQSKPHQDCYQTDTMPNDLRGPNTIPMQNKPFSNAFVDSNGNLMYDDNRLSNTYASTYPKECMQGVPISSMVNAIPLNDPNIKYDTSELHRKTQHNLLPSSVTTAYNNTVFNSANQTNSKNHINNLCASSYQSNANQLITNSQYMGSSMYRANLPSKKKSDRHRHRKVR